MAVSPSWLRVGAAMLVTAGGLGLGLGCKGHSGGSSSTKTYTVTGTVTYTRIPLHIGSDGVPTGLEADSTLYTKLPARGVQVRLYQGRPQTGADGVATTAWLAAGTAITDSSGNYSLSGIASGYPTFAELDSIGSGTGTQIRVMGEANGIDSTTPEPSRVIYCMRKGLDGTTSSTNPTPGTVIGGDSTVNFNVGLTDTWMLTPITWNLPSTGPFSYGATVAAGSRPMAILDSVYTFTAAYGDATPGSLDLHYRPGVRHPRGSFVEYDTTVYPHSWDGSYLHFFGSLAGDSVSDDAFLEGVIWSLLARNNLWNQRRTFLLPIAARPTSLSPELAVVDGLVDGMTASLLKSPYLPDTSLPSRYPPRDIRAISSLTTAQRTAYSVPNLTALNWELLLRANAISTNGVPTDWSRIATGNLYRFFRLTTPTITSGTATVQSDVTGPYIQLARLQESKASGDSVDLAPLFTDSILTTLLAKFNIPWTTAAAIPVTTVTWATDLDSLVTPVPSFTLSMAGAELVRGVYPNDSKGEVFYSMFALTKDRNYDLSITTVPALPADALIEVHFDDGGLGVFRYGGSNPLSNRIALGGNYADTTTPTWHRLAFRLVSPTTQQPDLVVTVHLNKAN